MFYINCTRGRKGGGERKKERKKEKRKGRKDGRKEGRKTVTWNNVGALSAHRKFTADSREPHKACSGLSSAGKMRGKSF